LKGFTPLPRDKEDRERVLTAANLITGVRILCAALLPWFPAFSPAFYALYLSAGLSDAVDGWVARHTGTAGDFGAKLDTVADILFFGASLVKLLPVLKPGLWIYLWAGAIAAVKAGNILLGFVREKRFAAIHTVMNKVTGALLFLLPLSLRWVDLRCGATAVCAVATLAALWETRLILTGQTGEPGKASEKTGRT